MKIIDPETIMYDRAQSKGYIELGPSFDVKQRCANGHEFTFRMHEYWYETNSRNKMYDYYEMDTTCPECGCKEVTRLEEPEDAKKRAKLERKISEPEKMPLESMKEPELDMTEPEPEPEEENPKRRRKREEVSLPPNKSVKRKGEKR